MDAGKAHMASNLFYVHDTVAKKPVWALQLQVIVLYTVRKHIHLLSVQGQG